MSSASKIRARARRLAQDARKASTTSIRSGINFGALQADLTPCVYCGVPASSKDHVPPVSIRDWLYLQQGLEAEMRRRFPPVEVPACHECNTLLGARWPWTVLGRKARIKIILRIRYRKVLAIPEWSDYEIGRLEDSPLKAKLLDKLALQQKIKERLAW